MTAKMKMGGYGLGMGRVVHYSIEYIRSPYRDPEKSLIPLAAQPPAFVISAGV